MRPSADGLADVAQEVFQRLARANEAVISSDPHGYLMRTAAQVEKERQERARRSGFAAGRNSFSRYEPALSEIQAAVNALPALTREILRLHLDGQSCQQIAHRIALTRDAVLRDLVGTYRHLRRELMRDE
jgi:DNA-directed RNA polymerase specialized sigma24 family protein